MGVIFSNKRDLMCSRGRTYSLTLLPCADPGLECAIGVTGKDDAFFPFGVNSFEKENVLVTPGLPPLTKDGERPRMDAFSISEG